MKRAKDKGYTPQDIQVLAPMYRGAAGIDALNKMMQEIFNPNDGTKKEVTFNDTVYRIGDKVLQLVNSPEDNVFNGDMGQIVGITLAKQSEDKVDELVIQFDANEVTYKRNEWNKITLSYCCSIHKSQGSEFQMVILPMVHQYQRMLQRNLLYTAVTRSKEMLILLGEPQAYQTCVSHESATRLTTLKERINGTEKMTPLQRAKLAQFEEADDPFYDDSSENTKAKMVASKPKENPSTEAAANQQATEKSPDSGLDLFAFAETEPSTSNQTEIAKPLSGGKDLSEGTTGEEALIEETPNDGVLTLTMVKKHLVDPMIGMKDCSPYDFMPAKNG